VQEVNMTMNTISRNILFFAVLIVSCTSVAEPEIPPPDMTYPGTVALSRENDHWVYKSFPTLLPLYVFDGDLPGESTCDLVCSAVWIPVTVQEGDKPVGRWTIVHREDGRLQWAYKRRPVYTFYQDTPGHPHGIGKKKDWYYDGTPKAMKAGTQRPVWRALDP
jgi:predicted lipoprotein with Yx(FWY)xxD motif